MAHELPIDIDYAKFLDWLVDRRRVSRGWHASLKAARVLLRSAADAMPSQSLITAPTSYFETVDALNLLTDTSKPAPFPSARDTDVLGRYSHPTSRAWSSAKSSYESGCAYLAEAAQILVRNTDVEASALRKEISVLKESLAECARKEGPTARAAVDAKDRFHTACAEFHICPPADALGCDFDAEVRREVEQKAPALLREAVAGAKRPAVAQALQYYRDFVGYASSDVGSDAEIETTAANGNTNSSLDTSTMCSSLNTVILGDMEELVAPVLLIPANERCVNSVAVDWGDSVTGGMIEASTAAESDGGDGGIDWGIEIDSEGSVFTNAVAVVSEPRESNGTYHSEGISSSQGIDWEESQPAESQIHTESERSANKSSLADSAFRDAYLNDLSELRCFLKQRQAELMQASDTQVSLVLLQAGNVPDAVRLVDTARVQEMSCAVEEAFNIVAGVDARRILGLQANNDVVARCARDLTEKMHVASRLERNIAHLASRKAQIAEQLRATVPKFESLASQTRNLKRRTEEKVQTFYSGREVNILGEINVVFPYEDVTQ
jgi:CDK5 regulatory subunit-associated protein 3